MVKLSYKADAHQAQMSILRHLLLSPSASFSELMRSTSLSSDHANFHIKRLIEAGFVSHVPKSYGEYELTRSGKEYANRMDTEEEVIEKQPKISVVLDIINEHGKHLQQQRLKQPYFGYWGRPTGKIRWGETILEAAARELLEETGLHADLQVCGFFHKLDYDDTGDLLEDKYFCLVRGTNPTGELLVETEGQKNQWLTDEEYATKDKTFGNLEEVQDWLDKGEQFIYEKKYTYSPDAY